MVPKAFVARAIWSVVVVMISHQAALGTDWFQYRGAATDGSSPDRILTPWPTNPTVIWRNAAATNGFSATVISQGRVFAMGMTDNGAGGYNECCVAIDATSGATLWSTVIDAAPPELDPHGIYYGGAGVAPWNTGDGPRTTPTAKDGRVFAFSGSLRLVCLNATNGAIIWNNDLQGMYGGTPPPQYDNGASPCIDDDLLFVNINTSTNNQTLLALNASDGSLAWLSQTNNSVHATPIVATIQGVRQVLFPTVDAIVSVERNTGNFLWKFTYPFSPIAVAMGASPVFYSNIVYCTASYSRGAAAARVVLTNGNWNVTQLYYIHEGPNPPLYYSSIWMSPVCYQGYIYTLAGNNGNGNNSGPLTTFLTAPLSCIELSTGIKKWSTNNFGMGGIILVNSNIVAITETGALVLIQPNPNAYTEISRFQAFTFTGSTPGKCWNSPSFSDGHIYARSTREVINVDVSPPAVAPSATTVGASNITTSAATLYGTVNPNGATSDAWFQWGLTTAYGSNTAVATGLAGNSAQTVTNALTGLVQGTTYHFRLVATNSAGTNAGVDASFSSALGLPVIVTQPRSRAGVVGGSASFSVVATNPPGNGYEWRLYVTNVLAGRTNATVSVTNLQANDFGDYTVRVTNSSGAVTSTVASLSHAIRPLISSNSFNLSTFFLTFSTEFGPIYYVDYKDFLSAQSWTPLTSVAGTGSPISITDNGLTNRSRFYRIRLQ
jgi:outer membrane protein assembly factor BamB